MAEERLNKPTAGQTQRKLQAHPLTNLLESKSDESSNYLERILASVESMSEQINQGRNRRGGLALDVDKDLTYTKLKQLEEIFTKADGDSGGSLGTDEFRKAVRHTMGDHITDQELDHMFMKVDTNCDGSVDWDEYLSYMLLEYKEKDAMNMMTQALPLPRDVQVVPNMNRYQRHHDTVVRLRLQPNIAKHANNLYTSYVDVTSGKYISVSKHGILNFWSVKLDHLRKHCLPSPKLHNKKIGLWVTDFVCVPNLNMIAVSSTSGTISFFDLTAYSFDTVLTLADLEICVTCMDYWVDPECPSRAKLLWGDVRGNVSALEFDDCTSICFLQPTINKHFKKRVEFTELMKQTTCGVKAYKLHKVHEDLVIEIKYVHVLHENFLSCCRGKDTSLYMGSLVGTSKRHAYFQVSKGVQTFDYSIRHNMIVTAGKDAMIRMWNPYSPHKPVMILQGTKSPILFVYVHDESEHIFSVSQEKEIHVFDIDTQICIQTIYRKWITIGTRMISASIFNPYRKALVLGNNKLAMFEHKEKDIKSLQLISHSTGITHVLYNELFDQVVSGGSNSLVVVWDADKGTRVIQFHTHLIPQIGGGNLEMEITAMRFDPTLRRLITAARDGIIKFWNHNNGGLLRQIKVHDTKDITGIICLKQRIMTAGWNRRITLYLDKEDDDSYNNWSKKHKEDITCLTHRKPSTIVSGSYDGDILLWMLETGHVTLHLNAHLSDKPISILHQQEDSTYEPDCKNMFLKTDSDSGDDSGSSSEDDEDTDGSAEEADDEAMMKTFMSYNTHRASIAAPIPQLPGQDQEEAIPKIQVTSANLLSAPPQLRGGLLGSQKRRPSAAFESRLETIQDGGTLNLLRTSSHGLAARSSGNIKAGSGSSLLPGLPGLSGGTKKKPRRASQLSSGFDLQKHLEELMNKNNVTLEDDEENENNDNNNITNKKDNIINIENRQTMNDIENTDDEIGHTETTANNNDIDERNTQNANNNNDGRFKIKRLLNVTKANVQSQVKKADVDKSAEARQKYDLYLKKNEASILKLVFLENRESHKETATLVSASSGGWIRFWVVEHGGGLVGQFNAAHHPGESAASICVDKDNEYLFTGDTEGYIKVWDISEYCLDMTKRPYRSFNYKKEKYGKFPLITQCDGKLKEKLVKQNRFRPPPLSTNPDVTWKAPELLNSFKGHMSGVAGISYLDASERLITCSGDCSVRMWTIYGQFVGIYGQSAPWSALFNFSSIDPDSLASGDNKTRRRRRGMVAKGTEVSVKKAKRKLPLDIRAVGSAATLRVLNNGIRPRWRLARNILLVWLPLLKRVQEKRNSRLQQFKPKILLPEPQKQTLKKKHVGSRGGRFKPWELDLDGVKNEIRLMDEKERTSDILGVSYKPQMKHKPFPKLPRIRSFQSQCDVYSSLPFFELAPVDAIFKPPQTVQEIIARNQLLMSTRTVKNIRRWKTLKSVGTGNRRRSSEKPNENKSYQKGKKNSTKGIKVQINDSRQEMGMKTIGEISGESSSSDIEPGSKMENINRNSGSISPSSSSFNSRDSKIMTRLPPITGAIEEN